MKKEWLVKTLALCIVVLFIGISFQPVFAINSKSKDEIIENKSNNENKLEYIIEITKENKVISYSVFLTEKEANDLDILIKSIHSKLNNSKSNVDTINIFYDAVDSFNGLGVFPDNISINEVKQLVIGENRNLDKIRFKNEMGDGFKNRLCLVACDTTNTLSIGPIVLLTALVFIPFFAYELFFGTISYNLSKFKILTMLMLVPLILLGYILLSLVVCSYLSITSVQPVSIGSLITFGYFEPAIFYPSYDKYCPSNGWIFTLGLNGTKSYNGSFFGQLFKIPAIYWYFYNGITGFTGISIRKPNHSIFRLGFGLQVNVGSEYWG